MEHDFGAAAGPSEGIGDSLDKKARFADGDFLDLEPASAGKGTRILGQFFLGCRSLVLGLLPEEVVVTIFGLLDLKTLVMTIPSVRRQPQPQPHSQSPDHRRLASD